MLGGSKLRYFLGYSWNWKDWLFYIKPKSFDSSLNQSSFWNFAFQFDIGTLADSQGGSKFWFGGRDEIEKIDCFVIDYKYLSVL
jgi:hypothetical protein